MSESVGLEHIRAEVTLTPSKRGMHIVQTCDLCLEKISDDSFARGNEHIARIVGLKHAREAADHLRKHGVL